MRKLTTMFQGQKLASLSYRKPMRSRAALSGGNTEGRGTVSCGEGQFDLKDVADSLLSRSSVLQML